MKSIKSNKDILLTSKATAIKNAVAQTGLPEKYVTLLYESENLDNLNNSINYIGFNGNMENNGLSNNFSISKEIEKILKSEELEKTKLTELNRLVQKATELNNLDSIDVLTGVGNFLLINDKKSKDYIIGINKLHDVELDELFESDVFESAINIHNDLEGKKQLFESIEILLHKQNKRWGNAYRMTNTYQGIMNYLKSEVDQLLISQEMVSMDTNFQMNIINDFINDGFNPLYRDFSSIRNLCPDTQNLVLDLSILVNDYISNNTEALEFVKRKTLMEYREYSNRLIMNISSSIQTSKILSDDIKQKLRNNYVDNNETSNENQSLIYTLTNNIDYNKFKGNNIQFIISTKAAHDMVMLINSTSVEFNLRLRPIIKSYVTKALELIKSVDNANFKLHKFRK